MTMHTSSWDYKEYVRQLHEQRCAYSVEEAIRLTMLLSSLLSKVVQIAYDCLIMDSRIHHVREILNINNHCGFKVVCEREFGYVK
jgi:hypothetical protein